MRPLRFLIPLVASCLLATACSLAKFGYDAFPVWAKWQIDSYLDLDDEQEEANRQAFDQFMAWHTRQELPKYANFLREVDARVVKSEDSADALQLADVRKWRERVVAMWPPAAERVAAPMARMLASLRPEQVQRMQRKMDDANKDMSKKFKLDSAKGMLDARGDRVIERVEFFLGKLGAAQKAEIRQQAAALPSDELLLMEERKARQRELVALIARLHTDKPAPAQAEKLTHDYLLGLFTPHDAQRRHAIEATQVASDEMTARVVAGATAEQRKYLLKTLRGFATDFDNRAKGG